MERHLEDAVRRRRPTLACNGQSFFPPQIPVGDMEMALKDEEALNKLFTDLFEFFVEFMEHYPGGIEINS